VNVDLDNDIDRLYVAPRGEFVRERDALARTLRAAGDRPAAAEVGALRKPTLVAWTVNQLAHRERRDIDLLLDAGKRIIDAQESSISKGGRADLDAAQASLRRAISGLTAQASEILGPEASRSTLTRVAETLRTAATAAAGRELLARGRLSEELSGTGWEIVAGFAPAPRAKSKRAAKQVDTPDDTAAKRAAEIQAQARRLRELKTSLTAAEKRRRTASRQERAVAERLEDLRAARSDADAEVESLGEEIAAAEQTLAELRRKAE
jgi:chromosome segregation ATPase